MTIGNKKNKVNLLQDNIKLKIKQLISEKIDNITKFSAGLGYSKGFITSILGKPDKFFNLIHIEKICAALNYPVARLFEDDVNSPEEAPPGQIAQKQTDPIEWALVEIFRRMSSEDKGKLLATAEDLRLAEAVPQRASKKVGAAA